MRLAAALIFFALSSQLFADELPECLKGLELKIFSDEECHGCAVFKQKLKDGGRLRGNSGSLRLSWKGHPFEIPIRVIELGYDPSPAVLKKAKELGFSGKSIPDILLCRDATPFAHYDRGEASSRILEQIVFNGGTTPEEEGFENEPKYFDPQLVYALNHSALPGISPDHQWWERRRQQIAGKCADIYQDVTPFRQGAPRPEKVELEKVEKNAIGLPDKKNAKSSPGDSPGANPGRETPTR